MSGRALLVVMIAALSACATAAPRAPAVVVAGPEAWWVRRDARGEAREIVACHVERTPRCVRIAAPRIAAGQAGNWLAGRDVPLQELRAPNVRAAATDEASELGRFTATPGRIHVATAQAGGQVDARELDPGCLGFVTRRPTWIVDVPEPADSVMFAALGPSGSDLTLAVAGPDGRFRCADDADGQLAPLLRARGSGAYQVWVGSYDETTVGDARLGVSVGGEIDPRSLRVE